MNAKKAKKLRQLVRHLVEKSGAGADTSYTARQFRTYETIQPLGEEKSVREVIHTTQILDKNCERAIYQQMKKNA
jgi:hypothetical protein